MERSINWLSESADEDSILSYCDHVLKCLEDPKKYALSRKVMHEVLTRSVKRIYIDENRPVPTILKDKIVKIHQLAKKQ